MSTHGFESAIVQQGRLLPGIHGLRGLAALAIVFYHLHHLVGLAAPEFFRFIGRDFGYSVHLFFVLSAFSLMHSTESRTDRQGWVHEYLIKRFFRIAPLFYTIILFELARQAYFGSFVQDVHSILLNLTFTFGFVPFSGFVWGGWSVGVEMIFYALFPVLILTIRSHRSALAFLVLSIVVSFSIRSSLHGQYLSTTPLPKWNWSYFAFASNLCFFAMGLYAYRVSHLVDKDSYLARTMIPLAAIIIIGSLLFFDFGKVLYGSGGLDIIVWGCGLSALCIWQSMRPSYLVANRIFESLGERSFSIYLIHPIVISFSKEPLAALYGSLSPHLGASAFFVCAALVLLVVLAVAEFTYRLIEVPGIDLGRRLILKRRGV